MTIEVLLSASVAVNAILGCSMISLLAQLKKQEICPVFNVLTRGALEAKWNRIRKRKNLAIAFLDIDNLKQHNSRLGQPECSKRLKEALAMARKDEIIARFYLGDEIVICAPVDQISHPVERIQNALREREMSATVAIYPYSGQVSLDGAVESANLKVQELKFQGKRGVVCWGDN